MSLTKTQKAYINQSNRVSACSNNVAKYESGANFNGLKLSEWRDKFNQAVKELNAIIMTDEDFEAVEAYYGC